MQHVDPKELILRHEEVFLQDFVAWASRRDPSEIYIYHDNGDCALAQYLKERGFALRPSVSTESWLDDEGTMHRIPSRIEHALIPERGYNQTFGRLVERLTA